MELPGLDWTPFLLPWVFALFLILATTDDTPGWLVRFAVVSLLYGVASFFMLLTVSFLEVSQGVMIGTAVGPFIVFFIFSILWKISRRRNPNSWVHKLIWVVLTPVLVVLGGAAFLPLVLAVWDLKLFLTILAAVVGCTLALGLLMGFFHLLGRIGRRYDL